MLQLLNLLFWLWLIVAGVEMVYEVIDKLLYVSSPCAVMILLTLLAVKLEFVHAAIVTDLHIWKS